MGASPPALDSPVFFANPNLNRCLFACASVSHALVHNSKPPLSTRPAVRLGKLTFPGSQRPEELRGPVLQPGWIPNLQ